MTGLAHQNIENSYIASPASIGRETGKALYFTKSNFKRTITNMSTNHINTMPATFTEGGPAQTPEPTSDDISHVLRLLDLPELRLESFSDEESLKVLATIQKFSGDSDDEFRCFLALPILICQAHQTTEAAEKVLFEKFAELEEAEDELNAYPKELDYDNDSDNKGSHEVRGGLLRKELPKLDNLTVAMREAHAHAAEGREELADLALEYLSTWLRILALSSGVDVVHESLHRMEAMHAARGIALEEAYRLLDAHPRYEDDWDDELVWDFIRDGKIALDLLISRGAIVISDTDIIGN